MFILTELLVTTFASGMFSAYPYPMDANSNHTTHRLKI